MENLSAKQKQILIGSAIALVVGGIGVWFYLKHREEEEEKELDEKRKKMKVGVPQNVVHVYHGEAPNTEMEKQEKKGGEL